MQQIKPGDINMSWGQKFFDEFFGYLQNQDIDGLVHSYHRSAELVSIDFALKGAAAIKQYCREASQKIRKDSKHEYGGILRFRRYGPLHHEHSIRELRNSHCQG